MKFTINTQTLVKMLKVISGGRVKQDGHLRVAAQDGRVTLATENLNEASCDAEITTEGVCFFKHKQLLPLLATYKSESSITMQFTTMGLAIGNTRAGLVIAYFADPSLAPQHLIVDKPEIRKPLEGDPNQMKFDL
jgi:hypothetical protein